jgi:hypothetical protein
MDFTIVYITKTFSLEVTVYLIFEQDPVSNISLLNRGLKVSHFLNKHSGCPLLCPLLSCR